MEPLTVGKYQLLDRIGSGGMAEVHLARVSGAAGFEKLVVVKRLLPALSEEKDYVAQFVDEARLAAAFSHANIVSTFDFGEADGNYFIAMEYVEGKNLRRVQDVLERRGKKLPAPAAIHIIAETCRGLDYAHSRKDSAGNPLNVVHRDVSPQNVVVSYGGDVKILDFGIAKSSAREFKTQAGIVKGKLRYMSPEQVAGDPIDGRSDQFAAAVILWELFFGKRWMPDMPDIELVHWVKKGEFVLPPGAPKPPDDLKAILDKALAVNRDDRYATCGEFAKALARYNSVRWPDFTATDLARLLDSEFSEDMRRERAWIAGILGGLAGDKSKPAVKAVTHPGFMPPPPESPPPRDEVPTVQTPSKGFVATGQSSSLPLVVGNIAEPRQPAPSASRSIKMALGQAPERPQGEPPPALTVLSPAKKRTRNVRFVVAAFSLVVAAAFVSEHLPGLGGTPSPRATPIAVATSAVVATPVIAATPAVSATPIAVASPQRTPTPTRTQIAIAPTPVRTPVPRRTATPAPTATARLAPTPPANAARVSVSVPLPGWAEVWIDGRQVSAETPLMNFAISPGAHEISVVKNGKKKSESIVLIAGERRTVVLPLPQ